MPKIVAVAGQKGGPGKTTTTINLGVHLQRDRGLRVLLIDADTAQGSLKLWSSIAVDGSPRSVIIQRGSLEQLRALDRIEGFDVLIIDCPGFLEEETAAALRVAHFALVPVTTSGMVLASIANTIGAIDEARADNPRLKHGLFINKAPTSGSSREDRARERLKGQPLFAAVVRRYNDHDDAIDCGTGVTHYAPESNAAADLRALAAELLERLKEGRE